MWSTCFTFSPFVPPPLFFFEMGFWLQSQAGLKTMVKLLFQSPNDALTTGMHYDSQLHSSGSRGAGRVLSVLSWLSWSSLAGLKLKRSSCLCFLSAVTKDVHQHNQLQTHH